MLTTPTHEPDWTDAATRAALRPPTYPARPINGGPLDKARPKSGAWIAEAKYNGWRAWLHVPTGMMFNRKNEPLSITAEFAPAIATLQAAVRSTFEWLDVEALERRHGIGRGSLIWFDTPTPGTWKERRFLMSVLAAVHQLPVHKDLNQPVANSSVYLPMHWRWAGVTDFTLAVQGAPVTTNLWQILQQCNTALGCEFFEGLVAKRTDSPYPIQLRSPDVEFPFWMKHRWAF